MKKLKSLNYKKIIILGLFFFSLPFISNFGGIVNANNVQIGTPTVAANQITFTVQWDNSWYTSSPANYDAVWVFVKYQDCNNPAIWDHAPLSTSSVHTVTGGVLQVDPVTDGLGVFVHRIGLGTGNISSSTVTLTFGGAMPAGTFNYKVFGIEMVNIPTGSYFIGDGASSSSFNNIQITSENALACSVLGPLAYGTWTAPCGTGINASLSPSIPAAYPKGYSQFYCMKYEVSQQQYVDFLNCLTYNQQAAATIYAPNIVAGAWVLSTGFYRNGIKITTSGVANTTPAVYGCDLGGTAFNVAPNGTYNETYDGQNVACNFLSSTYLENYLDWAALRPMTDMEFEKICRGVQGSSLPNEYVWGTTSITQATSRCTTAVNLNQNGIGELPSNSTYNGQASGIGLCAFGNYNSGSNQQMPYLVSGPLRCGFAATATTNRQTAGAGYWGVLDMAGNVWEQCVNTFNGTANSISPIFDGTLGDGDVSTGLPPTWPTGNTTTMIVKGGSWASSSTYCKISDRSFRNSTTYLGIHEETGGRGVRQY